MSLSSSASSAEIKREPHPSLPVPSTAIQEEPIPRNDQDNIDDIQTLFERVIGQKRGRPSVAQVQLRLPPTEHSKTSISNSSARSGKEKGKRVESSSSPSASPRTVQESSLAGARAGARAKRPRTDLPLTCPAPPSSRTEPHERIISALLQTDSTDAREIEESFQSLIRFRTQYGHHDSDLGGMFMLPPTAQDEWNRIFDLVFREYGKARELVPKEMRRYYPHLRWYSRAPGDQEEERENKGERGPVASASGVVAEQVVVESLSVPGTEADSARQVPLESTLASNLQRQCPAPQQPQPECQNMSTKLRRPHLDPIPSRPEGRPRNKQRRKRTFFPSPFSVGPSCLSTKPTNFDLVPKPSITIPASPGPPTLTLTPQTRPFRDCHERQVIPANSSLQLQHSLEESGETIPSKASGARDIRGGLSNQLVKKNTPGSMDAATTLLAMSIPVNNLRPLRRPLPSQDTLQASSPSPTLTSIITPLELSCQCQARHFATISSLSVPSSSPPTCSNNIPKTRPFPDPQKPSTTRPSTTPAQTLGVSFQYTQPQPSADSGLSQLVPAQVPSTRSTVDHTPHGGSHEKPRRGFWRDRPTWKAQDVRMTIGHLLRVSP